MCIWYDIGINLLSDLLFLLLILALSWGFWYFLTIPKAKRFFGTGQDARLNLYLSIHHDPTTTTRNVVTLEEFEAAGALKSSVTLQLRGSIFGRFSHFLFGLVGLEPNIPVPFFKYIRTTDTVTQLPQGGTVVIGGPVRNNLAGYVLSNSNPWIDFDTATSEFVINKGRRAGQKLKNPGSIAVVEKVIVEGEAMVLAYGFGEIHTKAAVNFLANNWLRLYKKFKDRPFAICMAVRTGGEVQIIEELFD